MQWQGELRAATRGVAREFWPKVAADGALAGRWDLLEACAMVQTMREAPGEAPRRDRLPPRTRLRRWDERPPVPTGRHLGAMSLDPVLDWSLGDGALRCLALLRSLAGPRGWLETMPSSLARQLGRHRNTARAYLQALEAAGYIRLDYDRRRQVYRVVLGVGLNPQPRPESRPAAAWPRPTMAGAWRRRGAQSPRRIKAGEELRGSGSAG